MSNPQLTPEDIAARARRVDALPGVVRIDAAQVEAADGRAEDPVLRDLRFYRGLTDVRMRSSRESEWGVYIAESSKVLRRALDAGHEPLSFLMGDKWAEDLADVLRAHPGVPAYVAADAVLEGLTGFHLHRGALAVMRRPRPLEVSELLDGARRIAVLEDIVDHTNIGAIFRSAAGLGVDGVLVTPRCADPLYRRAIRVSMGTVFQVPWARATSWPGDLETLREHGFVTAALALTEDSVSLEELAAEDHERLALILGTEGDGLGRGTLAAADRTVTIPMSHRVDSLNVAAASAVAFWETRARG
ncbi:RNA methyltransferase [Rothia sp. AR01]|uniref:RNA methyltransferase n=1 Tax=Rothia santali TaxID=2949643 RepID=A0A9X2KK05_9MICC|nr:RNA methyltransferase [Rothia santali]MCP3424526.1 RNA methyltransferase [Rothia santali]